MNYANFVVHRRNEALQAHPDAVMTKKNSFVCLGSKSFFFENFVRLQRFRRTRLPVLRFHATQHSHRDERHCPICKRYERGANRPSNRASARHKRHTASTNCQQAFGECIVAVISCCLLTMFPTFFRKKKFHTLFMSTMKNSLNRCHPIFQQRKSLLSITSRKLFLRFFSLFSFPPSFLLSLFPFPSFLFPLSFYYLFVLFPFYLNY